MNFKKILSEIWNSFFAWISLFGFIIISAGIGFRGKYRPGGETNWYFVAVGLILIFPLIYYLVKNKLISDKRSNEKEARIDKLLKTGDKVMVDLDKVEIHTNSYKQEISVGSGYQQRNEYVDVNHNVVMLKIPYKQEVIRFRLNIDMDPVKLKMHFAVKGETALYVDPQNPQNNYLDLTFLESR